MDMALINAVAARNPAAVRALLDTGAVAAVNHKAASGRTALCTAVEQQDVDMIELLLSYGADVTICSDDDRKFWQHVSGVLTPLEVAFNGWHRDMRAQINVDSSAPESVQSRAVRLARWRDVIKLLVARCDSFNFVVSAYGDLQMDYVMRPCTEHFFITEIAECPHNLELTKHLLRNGAATDFYCLYQHIPWSKTGINTEAASESFIRLALLSGCHFGEYRKQLRIDERERPWRVMHLQPLHDTVDALLSQPFSLQEVTIVAIRRSIGSRRLWAKIDALPQGLPRFLRDAIKLKWY